MAGMKLECPKCGSYDCRPRYRAAAQGQEEVDQRTQRGLPVGEYLSVYCNRCTYIWRTACKDA